MIQLARRPLPGNTARALRRLQSNVNAVKLYSDRVVEAKRRFAAKNTATDAVFKVIRRELTALCSGAARCVYCEDSARDQVEHYKPKTLYPEAAFVWENYVYACGRCNRMKGARFAVFRSSDGKFAEVSRLPGSPVTPPVAGKPVIIDCRAEDPMRLLQLDLLGTFFFLPLNGLSAANEKRAVHSIEVLRLNVREELPLGRAQAYHGFRARLHEYQQKRDAGSPSAELSQLRNNLLSANHPTVWREMVRQQKKINELGAIFARVPESLLWQ